MVVQWVGPSPALPWVWDSSLVWGALRQTSVLSWVCPLPLQPYVLCCRVRLQLPATTNGTGSSGNVCVYLAYILSSIAKCNQPVEEGTGDERTIKFYYDAAKSHCVPFFYYGQGGNDNRFDTEVSCMQACSDRHQELYPTGGAVCELPKDQGTCLALFLMFYYNVEEKTCRTFHYSGCGGNGNRFETREECLQTCGEELFLVLFLPFFVSSFIFFLNKLFMSIHQMSMNIMYVFTD
uniref:Tissue factor pathway inhibitor-like n=1 Tax=Scleropages formosus TaxID=113540 RepID=A0A8C9R9N8_SCLFO